MLLMTSVSALAYFSSHVLSSFSSPFASLGFLGSLERTRARPQRPATSSVAALYSATAALYALRS
jgi:hypothetical protein